MKPPIELKIDDIGYGGDGIARADGKVIFVPGAIPGEVVRAELVIEKSDFSRARILEILTPSPHRVQPRCRHFGVCGGCQLQHVSYNEQVRMKDAQARSVLNRLQTEPVTWAAPVPAEPPWSYRQRIQVHRSPKGWGFFKNQSHEVVLLEECPITRPEIMTALPAMVRNQPATVDDVDIVVAPGQKPVGFVPGFKMQGIEWLRNVGGKPMRTTGASFIQIHFEQNEKLVTTVVEMAKRLDPQLKVHRVWDLYAGNGNFSVSLSAESGAVVSIEESPQAHEDAKVNAAVNKISNVHCFCGDVIRSWNGALRAGTPDVIVLDPPRSGAKLLMPLIEKLSPKPALVYVSCEPPVLRRDLKSLTALGYQVVEAAMLDLFPQTSRFEMVLGLKPRS